MLLLDVVVYDAYSMVVEIRLERFKCFKIAAVDGLCENGCLNKELHDILNLQYLFNGFVKAFEIEDANRFLDCHLILTMKENLFHNTMLPALNRKIKLFSPQSILDISLCLTLPLKDGFKDVKWT
uniref:Uncharacterized protein n=1 Tax=Solanum lycopersicum TaxID=4081 RepID=A0A3Q7IMG6_SOLLC